MWKVLMIVCGVFFPVGSGLAQSGTAVADPRPSGAQDAAPALRTSFGKAAGWITKAADLVPADKYGYRPAPSVRTFGQLIAHIADEYTYYCTLAAGRNVEWSDAIEKGSTGKTAIAQKLKGALDLCNGAYGGGGKADALIDNLADAYLHYGNVVTYLRLLGLVPPSS
ncbi:MAG: hypothetical protein HY560_01230 [Gemmatimonadetes bacterium]|nr:hypothetical protein [Gemmatimonadota bacterium]